MKYCIGLVLTCLLLSGCSDPHKIDNEYVKSRNGKVYQVIAGIGDIYYLHEVNVSKILETTDFIKEKE